MKKIRSILDYIYENIDGIVYVFIGIVSVIVLGTVVVKGKVDNKKATDSLNKRYENVNVSMNAAGTYIYTFTDKDGHRYTVDESVINKYLD